MVLFFKVWTVTPFYQYFITFNIIPYQQPWFTIWYIKMFKKKSPSLVFTTTHYHKKNGFKQKWMKIFPTFIFYFYFFYFFIWYVIVKKYKLFKKIKIVTVDWWKKRVKKKKCLVQFILQKFEKKLFF